MSGGDENGLTKLPKALWALAAFAVVGLGFLLGQVASNGSQVSDPLPQRIVTQGNRTPIPNLEEAPPIPTLAVPRHAPAEEPAEAAAPTTESTPQATEFVEPEATPPSSSSNPPEITVAPNK